MWQSLFVLVVACSSSSSEPLCSTPPQTTYSCQPVSTGSAGSADCIGGPTWSPSNATADALHQDDPSKVFPERCEALIPDCSPFYKGSARMFTCSGGSWGEAL